MSRGALVSLCPDVLDLELIWSALLFVEHFEKYRLPGQSEDELKTHLSSRGCVEINASGYDPSHHFGPVITVELTVNGKKRELEIIVPWQKVLGVVRDKAGGFTPGFKPSL